MSFLSHLECTRCGRHFEAGKPHNLCPCGGTLYARYDLRAAGWTWDRKSLAAAPKNMWRYGPVLPCKKPGSVVSLGEGFTPMIGAMAREGPRPVKCTPRKLY